MEKWPQLISFALLILETVYLLSLIFLPLPGLVFSYLTCEVQVCLEATFATSVRLPLDKTADLFISLGSFFKITNNTGNSFLT